MTNSGKPVQGDNTTASVMDPHPTVVKSTDLVHSAMNHILQNRYRHLPVVDDEGRYLGIFGFNSLLQMLLPDTATRADGLKNESWSQETLDDLHERLMRCENYPVANCLRTDIPAVYPDTPLIETLLELYRTKCPVPVVAHADNKLLGMVSYFEIGHHILNA